MSNNSENNAVNTTKDDESFAMSILSDYKRANKRQFIIILVLIALWFSTIFFCVRTALYIFDNFDIGYYELQQDSEGSNYSIVDSDGVNIGPESPVHYDSEEEQ